MEEQFLGWRFWEFKRTTTFSLITILWTNWIDQWWCKKIVLQWWLVNWDLKMRSKKKGSRSKWAFLFYHLQACKLCVFSQYPNYHTLFSYWIWEKTNRKFLSGKTLLSVSRFFCIIYSTGFWMEEDLVKSKMTQELEKCEKFKICVPTRILIAEVEAGKDARLWCRTPNMRTAQLKVSLNEIDGWVILTKGEPSGRPYRSLRRLNWFLIS